MPRIIRAEYLSYRNQAQNSDKLFNIFIIQEDDDTFSCLTENGRRGSNLARRRLCTKARRESAESMLRQKLNDKRSHRETPYTNEPFGTNYSRIAREYGFNSQSAQTGDTTNSNPARRQTAPTETALTPVKPNVINFPVEKKEIPRAEQKTAGIFNQGQFDSLEI